MGTEGSRPVRLGPQPHDNREGLQRLAGAGGGGGRGRGHRGPKGNAGKKAPVFDARAR